MLVQLRDLFVRTGDRIAGVNAQMPPPPCVLCCSAGVMKSGVLRAATVLVSPRCLAVKAMHFIKHADAHSCDRS